MASIGCTNTISQSSSPTSPHFTKCEPKGEKIMAVCQQFLLPIHMILFKGLSMSVHKKVSR